MGETLIRGLIMLVCIVAAYFLALWALGQVGIVLPLVLVNLITVLVVLLALLWLYRTIKASGATWLP